MNAALRRHKYLVVPHSPLDSFATVELCADEALCGWAHPSLLTFSLARSDAQGLDRRGILTHLLALALGGALYFSLLLLADRPGRDSRCCRRGRQVGRGRAGG